MNSDAASDSTPARPAIRRLTIIVVPVAVTTLLADFLFWRSTVGVSAGIFFAALAVMLLALLRHRPKLRLAVVAAALAACCVQAGVEISLSNFLAAMTLLLALAGEIFQPHLAALWARFSEALFGFITAPVRWLGLAVGATRGWGAWRAPNITFIGRFMRVAWVLAPAAILSIIFAGIFISGNAIFAEFVTRLWRSAFEWLANLDISPARFVFWAFAATFALGIFHGVRAPDAARWWTRALPRLPRPDDRLARWQAVAVLLAMNAIFCLVNTIDAVYLWRSGHLPAGVNHTEFVHQGVWSLIAAVVCSAIIIAGMFQQEDRVMAGRWLKNLAHLWVAQNFMLIGGVFLRLKFYVDEFQLTEKRVYVGCFLLLVGAGFLFLAWFVEKRRTFNWLLGRNAAATFLLFFLLQFPDIAGTVARYDVERWMSSLGGRQPKNLDVEYLASLGPGAWPQLKIVATSDRAPSVSVGARLKLHEIRAQESAAAKSEDWREWQWRRARARLELQARP